MAMKKKLLNIRKCVLENKSNKKEIHLTKTKHLDIFILVFVLAVLGTSVFIVLNVFGVFTKVDTYIAIKSTVENGVNYDNELSCALHFKGRENRVNSAKSSATKIYTAALKTVHMHVDAENRYSESASISDINYFVNEVCTVDEEVYQIVKDAYAISDIDNNNYSIFAAPLYDAWFQLASFTKSNDYSLDPLFSETEKAYIEELTAIINNTDNYGLEFLDNNRIKLTISDTYKEFRTKYDIHGPIISLNVLENAYKLEAAKKALEENGFTDGYLASTSGLGVTLKDLEKLSHSIYNKDLSYGEIGYIALGGDYAFKKTTMFEINESNSYYHYQFTDNGKTYYRNLSLNLKTGYPNDYYLSTQIFEKTNNLKKAALDNQRLLMVDSLEKETAYITANQDIDLCLNKAESPNSYHLSKNLKEKIYIFKPEVYTINIINKEE